MKIGELTGSNNKKLNTLLYILLISLVIWCAGLLIEYIRSKLAELLKLELLSKKIINVINNSLEKLSVLLK